MVHGTLETSVCGAEKLMVSRLSLVLKSRWNRIRTRTGPRLLLCSELAEVLLLAGLCLDLARILWHETHRINMSLFKGTILDGRLHRLCLFLLEAQAFLESIMCCCTGRTLPVYAPWRLLGTLR